MNTKLELQRLIQKANDLERHVSGVTVLHLKQAVACLNCALNALRSEPEPDKPGAEPFVHRRD